MNRLLFICLFLLAASSSNAASWEKLFSAKSTDVFRSVKEVSSGGYILAGYTADSSVNDTDAYAVRMDVTGDTVWTFRYNGPSNRKDLFYKVIETDDGGFAFCGYTTGLANSDDVLVLKLDDNGNLDWVSTWGGNLRDRGQDIVQAMDGHYTVVGYTTSPPATYYDAFMIHLDSGGDTSWVKRYGGGSGSYDDANTLKQLPDEGYILGGQSSNGSNGLDQYLIRTDDDGNVIWTRRFGSTYTDNIESIIVLNDGFIFCGSTYDPATGDNGYVVRTDTAGIVMWDEVYGGPRPDDFHTIAEADGNNYILAGTTSSVGDSMPNLWMAKINDSGSLLWQKAYGGDNHDHGYSAVHTSDGGYVIVGHTSSFGYWYEEGYVAKTNSTGDISNKLVYTAPILLASPNASTCGSATTSVMVDIRNFSNAGISNIPLTVQVTGATTQTLSGTFSAASDTVTVGTINTSAGGTYTFTCITGNSNDVFPKRNTLTVTITLPPLQPAPTMTGDVRCGTGAVTLSASTTGTAYWFTTPSGGVSIFSGPTYSTTLSNTTNYYVQTGTVCPSARVPVTATIHQMPQSPVTQGASNCGPGALTINVTCNDPVDWYSTAAGGTSFHTGNTYTTPVLTSTTTYYIESSNTNCTSARVPVVATISSLASDPVTTDGSRCGPGSVILHATSADPVKWFDAPSGGTQVATGTTCVTPFIASTTTFYAQADNGCVSNRVPAIATVNAFAQDPVGNNTERCGPGTVMLTANSNFSLNWFALATGGNQIGSGNVFITPSLSNTTTYYVEAFDGTCPSGRVAVQAIINTIPSIYLGNDTNIVSGPYLIDAGVGFSDYLWSNGATTQTITVNSTDTYCVTVTDAKGCTTSDCILVDYSIGIADNELNLLMVYPNPSSGNFIIELPVAKDAVMTVTNIEGQVIIREQLSSEKTYIDLSAFAKGIYTLSLKSADGWVNRKLVIE